MLLEHAVQCTCTPLYSVYSTRSYYFAIEEYAKYYLSSEEKNAS
jgi:hypothetical protein